MEMMAVKRAMLLNLSRASKNEINLKVPNSGNDLNWLASVDQDWIDQLGGPKSTLPIARVCLEDALSSACQAEYALEQAYAHIIWFQKECSDAPNESYAHHYGRFYVDDAILRLFSSAEHVATFIKSLRNISNANLNRKNNGTGALAGDVGKYLAKQMPNDPITRIINCLHSSEWELLRKYRNDWVHNKPQILDNLGLDYRRKNRWHTVAGAKMVTLGGRQVPDQTLDNLLEKISRASGGFSEALSKLTDVFFQELESLGIMRDVNAGTISPPDDFWTRVPDGVF